MFFVFAFFLCFWLCVCRFTIAEIETNGWLYYWQSDTIYCDPHYQSWLWVIYIYTCNVTGYQPMCDRSFIGISKMMDAFYSQTMHWANGLTQEYSRM